MSNLSTSQLKNKANINATLKHNFTQNLVSTRDFCVELQSLSVFNGSINILTKVRGTHSK